ncbi:MAG: SGNH/GDSL hydrolase family protein [Microcoleaceae cyanobacterium]
MSFNTISPRITAIQSNYIEGAIYPNHFNQIYIFGDSLSDPGNLFSITQGEIPASPSYPQQRFSNGLVWSEYFAAKFGLSPKPFAHSLACEDGINFAVGGATTGKTNINGATYPSLQQQLDAFITPLHQTHQRANPSALYILWAGANDYLGGNITDPAIPIANLSQSIQALYQVGARYILVLNLPELGDTPLAHNNEAINPTQLNQLSHAHNTLLKTTLEQLRQSLTGIELGLMDIRALFKMAIANPEQLGLKNVTDSCQIVACLRPEQYLFWDQLHPTTAAHQIIAETVFSALQLSSQSCHKSITSKDAGNKLAVVEAFLLNQRRA